VGNPKPMRTRPASLCRHRGPHKSEVKVAAPRAARSLAVASTELLACPARAPEHAHRRSLHSFPPQTPAASALRSARRRPGRQNTAVGGPVEGRRSSNTSASTATHLLVAHGGQPVCDDPRIVGGQGHVVARAFAVVVPPKLCHLCRGAHGQPHLSRWPCGRAAAAGPAGCGYSCIMYSRTKLPNYPITCSHCI
jgi:hypothetical protein